MMLRNKSLKEKLVVIILAISTICVTLTTGAITISGIVGLSDKMVTDMEKSTELKAGRISAYVEFDNEDNIRRVNEILSNSASEDETMICVYKSDDMLLENAAYELTRITRKNMSGKNCPAVGDIQKYKTPTFEGNSLKTYQVITGKTNEKIGFIYVQTNLDEIEMFVMKQLLMALGAMAAALALSLILANKLQRSITDPILKLVETTRKVSNDRDYSIRAENFLGENEVKKNEISILIDAFNHMLNEMEERRKLLLRKNQELVKAKEVAESANRAKSQFLANISHELRTPLNAVIGFSDIIYKEMLGPIENKKYIEYSKDINESGEHLLHIINDILDLSKAEAGKLEPVLREISVAKSINECITFISKRAEDNLIAVETNIPEGLPNMVVDRVMFKRIIANLLSNALKFSNSGGKITISVDTKLSTRNENIFTISIQDTGIGMSKDDVELAFKSFVQLDGGLNRKYEGTGLGLPLTKKLVELHGGTIELQSKVGEGTNAILKFYSPVNIGN